MRGIVTRTLLGWLEQRALEASAAELSARSGAVVFAQRFASALNLNLHFHALVLDGAFVSPSERLAPSFQPAAPLSDADVAELVEQLARRITRYLERHGRLPRAHSPTYANESASRLTRIPSARAADPARVERLATPPHEPNLGADGPVDGSLSRGAARVRGARRPLPAKVSRLEFLSAESFNGKLRDQLLNGEIFFPLGEARAVIEALRREYNHVRPHSSLNYRPPAPLAM